MDICESVELIKSFYKGPLDLGTTNNTEKSKALEAEKGISFPEELKRYINDFIPSSNICLVSIGNPLQIYSRDRLSWVLPGYNFNPVLNEAISHWDMQWFMIADQGADPVIVKLDEQQATSKVFIAMHGAGCWDFEPIADSIGQFLLCSAAMEHALTWFDQEDSIIDDENGFNLAEKPAQWLFPFIKKYAARYYQHWLSDFDNA